MKNASVTPAFFAMLQTAVLSFPPENEQLTRGFCGAFCRISRIAFRSMFLMWKAFFSTASSHEGFGRDLIGETLLSSFILTAPSLRMPVPYLFL